MEIRASQGRIHAKKSLEKTALLRNSDGSIYHLNLLPGELAETIIFVGDPERVTRVSQHFDHIEVQKRKRELVTHTGELNGQRISVVSTGIGTDNIDIVLNECDALHNVDLKNNCVKDKITPLRFLRLGTCGGVGETIDVDTLVLSSFAVGFSLMSFYQYQHSNDEAALLNNIQRHFNRLPAFNNAYVAKASWTEPFTSHCHAGITLTCPGFYGPQHRMLRAPLIAENILDIATQFSSKQGAITNVEMETAGIYALANLFGHQACSISAVLDNGTTDVVSKNMQATVDGMIETILDAL